MAAAQHPWGIEALDLDGYLGRLGVRARPPGRDALDELHEAHVRAFTFDNIDVLLAATASSSTGSRSSPYRSPTRSGNACSRPSPLSETAPRMPESRLNPV